MREKKDLGGFFYKLLKNEQDMAKAPENTVAFAALYNRVSWFCNLNWNQYSAWLQMPWPPQKRPVDIKQF
jgi:hypothetical protein